MSSIKTYYIIPILILNLFLFFSPKEVIESFIYQNNDTTQLFTINVNQTLIQKSISPDTNTHNHDTLSRHNYKQYIKSDSSLIFNYQNLKDYIFSNLFYPSKAQEKGIEGEVQVYFCIQKDGSITHTHIVKSVHPLLDSAALQLIQTMPHWKPFTQKPAPDSLSYTIPVTFELKND